MAVIIEHGRYRRNKEKNLRRQYTAAQGKRKASRLYPEGGCSYTLEELMAIEERLLYN